MKCSFDERRGHSRTKRREEREKREKRKHLTMESQFNKGNTGVPELAFKGEKVEWKEGTTVSSAALLLFHSPRGDKWPDAGRDVSRYSGLTHSHLHTHTDLR